MTRRALSAAGLLLALFCLAGCGSTPDKKDESAGPGPVRSMTGAEQALAGGRGNEAVAWLDLHAADPSSPLHETALRRLAKVFSEGTSVEKDQHRAARYYLRLAERGDTDAQAEMAHRYHHGLGVPKNPAHSVQWARKAAEQGNAEGQLFLGWAYEHGIGLPQNYMRAARLYENAAAQGNGPAMYHLGTLHQRGRVFATNNERAITLYHKAAEKGYGPAHLALGFIHLVGDGVPKNPQRALDHFLKASDAEVAEGAFQAARLIEARGEKIAARELYRRAYLLGKVSAMQDVRRMDGRPTKVETQIGG